MLIQSSYDRPYFEAWRVEDGEVKYDYTCPDDFDDSFSNCHNGIIEDLVIEQNEAIIKGKQIPHAFIAYNCMVYWVPDNSATAKEINMWKPGNAIDIKMAGKQKASYLRPQGLKNGIERNFKADFLLEEDIIYNRQAFQKERLTWLI